MADKITETTLKAIISAEIANCDGSAGSALANERAANLDAYFARPYGNEQVGRSSVVSTTVRDAVEWLLPTLMRIFTSGEDVVVFEPEGENDIAIAKQATEYVNFIWNRDNPGFLTMYSWFKDALICKNGLVKIWWDDTPKTKRERYQGLPDSAFAEIVNAKDIEVAEHTERHVEAPALPQPDGQPSPSQTITVHDVVLTRSIPGGRVCIECVPPEEFLISLDARSIETARMVGHKRKRTLSDLIESGFDKATVNGISSDQAGSNADTNSDQQVIARNTVENLVDGTSTAVDNPAMREVWVTECYIQVDVDGDGIAEMRKITVAGTGNTILSNEAWDTRRPFAGLTPIILPHRFNGLAVADVIKDLQLIFSTILRQYLDNLYLSNNQREEVLENNIIEPSEVLSAKPGQKIRIKNGQAVFPIVVPNIGAQALEGLAYISQLIENRTGVSARTQGLGSNPLHETARGEQIMMTAAMGKIELIARVFAETGVKEAFRIILEIITKYQDAPRTVRLTGEQFVSVDPTNWNPDMNLRVSVGISTGDKEQQLQHAMVIAAAQEKLFPLGYVSPDNIMATNEMIVNATGQKGADRFFTKPDPQAQAQHPPDPALVKVQMEGQQKQAQMQQDGQIQAQQMQMQAQQHAATLAQEGELKKYQIDQELALKREQLAAELQLKQAQLTAELELKRELGTLAANNKSASIGNVAVGGEPG